MDWLEDFSQEIYVKFDLTDTLLYHESFGLLKVTGHNPQKRQQLFVEQLEDSDNNSILLHGFLDMDEDGGIEIVTLIKKPIEQLGETTLYIGAPTGQKAIECKELGWGAMLTPDMFRNSAKNHIFAMDNGVFAQFKQNPKKQFDGNKFLKYLHTMLQKNVFPDFVVIPDKIGVEPEESIKLSLSWIERLRVFPFPIYFVVQDGMTTEILESYNIHNLVDGIFVGGKPTFKGFGSKEGNNHNNEWKIRTGAMWVNFAHKHNIRAHIGRVSSVKRFRWARAIKADSCDTSQPVFSNSAWNRFKKANRQSILCFAA